METPKFLSDCIKHRHNMTLYQILTKILYENIDLEIYNDIKNYIITGLLGPRGFNEVKDAQI
jgi:hypothetical protein